MSLHYEQELEALKQKLLTMAGHAEMSVSRAIRSLTEHDDALARQVKTDDAILDRFEMEIDEMSIALLSKAPLASELRLVAVAMKISRDLERVGDEATTIARRALELNREPQLKPYIDIPHMAELGLGMLKTALDTFVHHDPDRARGIIPHDKEVDDLNRQVNRELAGYMVENPATITRCLNLMVISKCLERIADHAKNIAEDVVYLYEALDIRHAGKDSPPTSEPSANGSKTV